MSARPTPQKESHPIRWKNIPAQKIRDRIFACSNIPSDRMGFFLGLFSGDRRKSAHWNGYTKKQNREKFQYRKWTMGAAKMRLSIFCVRDDLSIFYIGIFHGSSALASPFSGRLLPAANQNCIHISTLLTKGKYLVYHRKDY